jgi:glycosyltransferase involved in cell wall biosynthesis
MARLGHKVSVFAEGRDGVMDRDGYQVIALGGSLRVLGPISGGKDSLPTLSPFFSPSFLVRASQRIPEIGADVIYTVGTPIASLLGAALGRKTHLPTVHHVFLIPSRAWWRAGLIQGYPTPVRRILLYAPKDAIQELVKPVFLAKWGLSRVGQVLAASEDLRCRLGHFVPRAESIPVVFPGVDVLPESDSQTGEPLVTYFGHLSQERGTLDALEAFARIAVRFPSASFCAASTDVTPPVEAYFQQIVARHGLSTRVSRRGIVANVQRDLLAPASCIVLPYRTAPSIKLMEAMAAGKPVITTRLDWTPEVVEDGVNGFLVPVGDVDAIAQRMAWLLENPKLALEMGCRARNTIRTRFSLDRSAQQVIDIMMGLVQEVAA